MVLLQLDTAIKNSNNDNHLINIVITLTTFFLTFIAMLAFAANSLLCRMALLEGYIDAGSFTIIRVVSGALVLLVISQYSRKSQPRPLIPMQAKLISSVSLFGYALLFSFAYIELGTGTGALILFGVVQLSMLLVHKIRGHHISVYEWAGILVAIVGFVVLLLPSATRPDMFAALLMAVAGVCWAVFTIQGKSTGSPLLSTRSGFAGGAIICLFVSPWLLEMDNITSTGLLLAVISGVITSGLGYVIWYMALRQLTVLTASIVQLSVPALALLAGAIVVGEPLTTNIIISTSLILAGIAAVFVAQQKVSARG